MLCNVTPITAAIHSIMNNAKTLTRFDKYVLIAEKPDLYYMDRFISELELSPETLKAVEKSINSFYDNNNMFDKSNFNKIETLRAKEKSLNSLHGNNNIFHNRNFNKFGFLLKRDFHTKKSNLYPSNNNDNKEVKSTNDTSQKLQLRDLLSKYNSKPSIQQSINEAYKLASENALNMLINDGIKRRHFAIGKYLVYFTAIILMYYLWDNQFNKNIGGSVNNSGIGKIFSKTWSQSGASLVTRVDVKFDDVQGCDEVKKELQDVVHFLRNPSHFTEVGAKLPKGVLLIGEPGIGKTLLARAVAGEAGVPFLYVSGSQFDEMFVGVGASRVRALFTEAKEHSPCVVFIDELDAVCGERTSSPSHPYANQTINQLLSEMDGFVENEGIIIIGATNRVKALDKAVLRPGRFDLKVQVHRPDYRGRVALFELYLSKVTVDDHIDIGSLARSTTGYTGADVKNMVNQAAIICVLKEEAAVTMSHLWEAQTKTTLGAARSRPMQESENRLTAYHEAGHSIVTYFSPNSSNKVKLVTILPRGESGGHNSFVPKVESNFYSKAQLEAMIDGLMGGRAAEELLAGPDNISTGVSSDMEKATSLARQMVKQFTMASSPPPPGGDGGAGVGLQVYKADGCECGGSSRSPKVAEAIDTEVNRILRQAYERATRILEEHSREWRSLAENLLLYETLDGDDVDLIIAGKTPKVAMINSDDNNNNNSNNNNNNSGSGSKLGSSFSEGTKRLWNILSTKDIKK